MLFRSPTTEIYTLRYTLSLHDALPIARAQARAAAEIEVRRDNPAFWLRVGPGRSRPGAPGWTDRQEIAIEGGVTRFTLALGEHSEDAS